MGFDYVFRMVLGLIKGSRWRKASKCKNLIKQLKRHLIIQKNRRNAITRQSRLDIAQLLHNGLHHVALSRVEQLYKDQCLLSAYAQLDQFCDCISTNFCDISRRSKLSTNVSEALSSLIFAASRCGELPELHLIRNLFKQHFGQDFERVNVELLPGNNVNSELKYNLSSNSVPDDAKLQLTNDILNVDMLCLGSQINHQDFVPEHQNLLLSRLCRKKQELEKRGEFWDFGIKSISNKPTTKDQMPASKFEEMVRRIGSKFSLSDCKNLLTFRCDSYDSSDSTAGSGSSTNINTVAVKMQNPEFSSNRTASIGAPPIQEMAIVNVNDIEVQSSRGEFFSGKHELASLDSWVGNVRSMTSYVKKKNIHQRRDALIKNDTEYAICDRLHSENKRNYREKVVKEGLALYSSNEGEVVTEACHGEIEEESEPRLSHVHPKLPDYDELIAKFADLKKEHLINNSNNQALRKWMWW